MHRRAALALLLLPCALSPMGCAPAPTVRLVRPQVPRDLLECAAEPPPPPAGATDADLASWILDLADAGADCRTTLQALARVVNSP